MVMAVVFMILSQLKSRYLLFSVLWLIGIGLLFLDYVLPFRGSFSYDQFWLGILFCMLPVVFLVFDKSVSSVGKMFTLLIWSVTLYLPKVLRSPSFFNFQDETYHFQVLTLIHEQGTLFVAPTILNKLPVILHYPGLELLTNSLVSTTGLTLFPTSVFVIGVLHSIVPLFIFLMVRRIFHNDVIGAIGAFLFMCNPSYIFFDSLFSYESLGIFLSVFLVFLLTEMFLSTGNKKRLFLCLSSIVFLGIVITHPFSTYMVILFLLILAIVQYRTNGKKSYEEKSFSYFALLAVSILLAWQVYSAPGTVTYFAQLASQRISSILSFFAPGGQRVLFASSPLPSYEVYVDYLYFPLILLLSALSLYYIYKDKFHNTFIDSFVVFGPLLTFLLFLLVPTGADEIAYRSMPFLFIGLAPILAYGVNRVTQYRHRHRRYLLKVFVFAAVVLIAIAGISLRGDESGRFLGSSNFASGPSAVTSNVVSASTWFASVAGRYNNIMGDETTSIVFGGFGVQNVVTYDAWDVFYPKTVNATVTGTLIISNITYLVVDNRLTEFLAQYGYYFEADQVNVKNLPSYGVTQPLPAVCVNKFANSTFFNRLYSNGNISIYNFNP